MIDVLLITSTLSKLLQSKTIDILTAVSLIKSTKESIEELKSVPSLERLYEKTGVFCSKNLIPVPGFEADYVPRGRSRRGLEPKSNQQFYSSLLIEIVDELLHEMDERFSECSSELLSCMSALDPRKGFSDWSPAHKAKVIKLANFYPQEFSASDLRALEFEIPLFVSGMKALDESVLLDLESFEALSVFFVDSSRDSVFPNIAKLIGLVLTLPVTTASGERSFSAMKIIKNRLRSKMGQEFLRGLLIVGIEKELAAKISNFQVIDRYHSSGPRRGADEM
jgi:hypothetical protein